MSLEARLKARAGELGFELVGIAAAQRAGTFDAFRDWLEAGHAGEMGYLTKHAEAHAAPSFILPSAKSVVMVGMNYKPPHSRPLSPEDGEGEERHLPPPSLLGKGAGGLGSGRISLYAHGSDYHKVLKDRLKQLLAWLQIEVPGCRGRTVVDTTPLLERDFARLAGLGWFGKNTMLLNKRLGSYFFLGALLLDIELVPDAPMETSHCGTCTACLDACPTDAFTTPYVLDARKCISYLTIELRGPIPHELREPMGDWIFGCDVCQEVCPWNRKPLPTTELAFAPREPAPDLIELLEELLTMSDGDFDRRYAGTPLTRPGRTAFTRNALIALANTGDETCLHVLARAAANTDALIRETALWAREQIQSRVPRLLTSDL
jgi:epoxyqueuosine reductase